MASFPVLKTGAVAQYGSDRESRFSTHVHEFVDGAEQRFGGYSAGLKRWVVRLTLLNEDELLRLERFFEEQAGAAGSFEFTDPWDGTLYTDCSFESDDLALVFGGVADGSTSVVIRENR
jgi:phage-related protein